METRNIDLTKLNSATKYPSILTLHALGEKGRLKDELNVEPTEDMVVTEKIDGTNTRIIFTPDDLYLIGSREHLLHAKSDLIHNPALGIVDSVREIADRIDRNLERQKDAFTIVYLETYGGKTTPAARNYTSDQSFGHRVFDIAIVESGVLPMSTSEIASWRERGSQHFAHESDLQEFSCSYDLELTKRLEAPMLPTGHEEVLSWLEGVIPRTWAALDPSADAVPEGVVVRSSDRKRIAKVRYSDYKRTLKSGR